MEDDVMGKKKRLQVHDEYGKPVPQDERKLKEKIVDGIEAGYDRKVAQIRATQLPRWRGICGVETDSEIDYDNPYVHLEWFLCDFRVQVKLMNGQRDYALERMDESQR